MNELQQHAYDLMIKGNSVFLTGSAGTGKSYLIKKFVKLYGDGLKIGLTSTTGVSAVLLGGNTIHSFLGIGLGTHPVEILITKISTANKKVWLNLDILIIDEISMLSLELFEKLELMARVIRNNNLPFGGIQLILSGDFLQLSPVSSNEFCFESKIWEKCIKHTICLTQIVRQDDILFQNVLSEIRVGKISDTTKDFLSNLNNKELKTNDILPTLINTTNVSVDVINDKELYSLNKNGLEYYSYSITHEFHQTEDKKILEKYYKKCNAKQELILCIGAQVMLLVNLDIAKGLCNGSRGVVTRFIDDEPVVKFLNNKEMIIKQHDYVFKDSNDNSFLTLSQIPLKLAWCLTVHSCQGQTIDCAIVDLQNVFCYAQVYVALSRVKNSEYLSIKNLNFKSIKAHPKALEFYKN